MKNPVTRLTILFFLPLLQINSATAQSTFQKAFTEGTGYAQAVDAVVTTGGYVLAGHSYANGSGYKPFLMKVDEDGNQVWMKHYAMSSNESYFNKVIAANDGGFLAVGTSHDWLNGEILLVKTDANGDLEWQKMIPSYTTNRRNAGEWIYPVNGGYIVSGESSKNEGNAVLTRIDNDGQTVWSKRYAINFFSNPRAWAGFVSGDTIFAGGFRDSVGLFSMFDAVTGNPLTSVLISDHGPDDKSLRFMAPAADGDLLLADYAVVSDASNPSSQSTAPWVCRVSRTGDLRWSKTYTNVVQGRISALSGGNFLLTTTYQYFQGTLDLNPALVKINGDGEVLWSYQYGITGTDGFATAIETPDGGILAVGTVRLPGSGINQSSILVVKTDANGLVAGCCSQPISTAAQAFPVELSTAPMNQFAFDPTIDSGLPGGPGSLSELDYCPPLSRKVDVFLCPGDALVVDGTSYTSPGMVTTTVTGPTCDTIITYTIKTGVNPTLEETISFCAGDTIILYGQAYTQPAVFTQAIPSATGHCDTLVTYTLQYATPAGPRAVSIQCPQDIAVQVPYGTTATPVIYTEPVAQSDCPCPGVRLLRTGGQASGSAFPVGNQTVCFQARDSCGNTAACCFQVHITAEDATTSCDVKTNGCITFELLRITRDAAGRRTYSIRVQNNCSQPLEYAAFQLPGSVTAYAPQSNNSYTTAGGNLYTVRNPNYAPVYSIRFSAQGVGIHGGGSDIFNYTLPPQSAPDYINVLAKLTGQSYMEAYLNTFNCPVEAAATAPNQTENRNSDTATSGASLLLYPNPAETALHIDFMAWAGQPTQIRVMNLQGQVLLTRETEAGQLTLPLDLSSGMYWLEATLLEGRQRQLGRFVVR